MVNFRLRIYFRGMCVFVPEIVHGKRRLWAFLPDLRRGSPEIPGTEPHGGVINFSVSDIPGTTSIPSTAEGMWKLDNQDILIRAEDSGNLDINGFDGGVLRAPDPNGELNRFHFGHLASLEEAGAARGLVGIGRVKPTLLKRRIPEADQQGILARFLFTEGVVTTEALYAYNDRPIVWQFRPPGVPGTAKDHRQYIASGVRVEIEVEKPYIEILARKFNGSMPQKLVLRPSVSGEIDLTVMNEESGALTGLGTPEEIKPGCERPADRMFALYNRLCSRQLPLEKIPIPVAERIEGGGGLMLDPTWGSPPCSTGRLQAPDDESKQKGETGESISH